MKNQTIKTALLFFALTLFFSCKKKPAPVPEEQELITTVKLYVTDSLGFSTFFTYKVENGFGSAAGGTVQIDTIKLASNKTYYVTVGLFNEKASPTDTITDEVLNERNDHLFLYQSEPVAGAGSVSFTNGSKDLNGRPFNQSVTFTTGNTGAGKLQVSLIHAPTNKDGTTPDATGGETDAQAIFPVKIE